MYLQTLPPEQNSIRMKRYIYYINEKQWDGGGEEGG